MKILSCVSCCSCGRTKINFELNLSICATKSDVKKVTSVETLDSSEKTAIFNLKKDGDKLNLGKLGTFPGEI